MIHAVTRHRRSLVRPTLAAAVVFGAMALMSGSAVAASGGSPASGWHIGYYTPSPHGTLSNAQAASTANGFASLNFTAAANTALLYTDQKAQNPSLLGDLTGKTITANFTITGVTGAFTYYGEPDACGTPANTRLYFATSKAGGFAYTQYWWSHPASAVLSNGTFTVTATVEPSEWSDWNGQQGSTVPDGFAAAASNVMNFGLSFGGGCGFENGVGTSDGSGTLTLNSFTAS